MYKISNDIIHVNKSKYFTPVTETRTRGSHGFKYFIEHTSDDVFKDSYFPRTMKELGIASLLTLYLPNL